MSLHDIFAEDYEAFLHRLFSLDNEIRVVRTSNNSIWRNISKLKYLLIMILIYKLFRYFQKKTIPFKTLLLKYYYKKNL